MVYEGCGKRIFINSEEAADITSALDAGNGDYSILII